MQPMAHVPDGGGKAARCQWGCCGYITQRFGPNRASATNKRVQRAVKRAKRQRDRRSIDWERG